MVIFCVYLWSRSPNITRPAAQQGSQYFKLIPGRIGSGTLTVGLAYYMLRVIGTMIVSFYLLDTMSLLPSGALIMELRS